MSVKPLLIVVPGIICHKMLSRQAFSILNAQGWIVSFRP
jgi:hypothetical protein